MAKIRLKYVNKFANKNRANKRLRYYFRLRGHKAIPLPGLPGCEEFMQAYAQALAGLPDAKPETGEKRIVPGTINAICRVLLSIGRMGSTCARHPRWKAADCRKISDWHTGPSAWIC